ncbi:Fumarylacetoacetase [Tolypocladium ophioglossoides CBS 100239]|uniref:Fumarylacetoacetase n=1 Tax=Tolypocladium ophioglossoides (strain CBS 100239) TaxID=1163406 RepID=A0A0L0NIE0_TOLOC|nr:Fumarylacetoacetase [Tolypocladium ophioglossoides CBS 100239]
MATPFTIDNLPYGVISTASNPKPRCAAAFEVNAIELDALEKDGFFGDIPGFEGNCIFGQRHLNDFAVLSKEIRAEVRRRLKRFLSDSQDASNKYLTPLETVTNHLPMNTFNYSDFYCSLEHAQNCARVMKVDMQPNWFSIPSVYCGRTSSLTVSGTPVVRPHGVIQESPASVPVYAATRKLDFELEMGVFLSKPLPPGRRLSTEEATEHIFGFVILNDWSSRDIQSFEMTPLGPFHSKGFMTSISPWIVTLEALQGSETSRTIPQSPPPLPHLAWNGPSDSATFDIDLSVEIIRE